MIEYCRCSEKWMTFNENFRNSNLWLALLGNDNKKWYDAHNFFFDSFRRCHSRSLAIQVKTQIVFKSIWQSCRVIFSNKKERKKGSYKSIVVWQCESVFSVCVWWIKSVNLGSACATKIIKRAPSECIGKRLLAIGFSCTPKVSTLFEWCVSVCVF